MLDNTYHARKYHAGKYIPFWKIHTMLENPYHSGQLPIPGKRAVMYLWLDLSILRLYVILIFFWELFRQCGNIDFFILFT
jgi:hypothetical protein